MTLPILSPSGSAAADSAAIQKAYDDHGGFIADAGGFKIDREIIRPSASFLDGRGSGVTIFDWQGPDAARAMFVDQNYGRTSLNFHGHLSGCTIEMGHPAGVAGILAQEAYALYSDVWVMNAGGKGHVMDTRSVVGTGAVHNKVTDCRYSTKDVSLDFLGAQTDTVVQEVTYIKQTTPVLGRPDLHMEHAGGAQILESHHNGAPGDCISLDSAMATEVRGVYGDGFGCVAAAGGLYAAVRVAQLASGDDGSAVIVSHLRNRHRARVGGATDTVDVIVGGGFAGVVNISDLVTWNRKGAPPAASWALNLNDRHAYTLAGINPMPAFPAGQIYLGTKPSHVVVGASRAGV